MREINEEALANQIPEYQSEAVEATESAPVEAQQTQEITIEQPERTMPDNDPGRFIGTKLTHQVGGYAETDKEADKQMVSEKRLTKIGEKIGANADIRDGWIPVDKQLCLGDRAKFYPESWQFRVRPANVEAIRNWSTIDDENPNSVDDVFNEILKSCLSIVTPEGPKPWSQIRPWDRFFFITLIREYTFRQGESKLEFTEDCPNCDNPVTFTLNSQSLMYEMPDPEVMQYYSQEEQTWVIDPAEFDVNEEEPITLYLPTLEREANIKAWIIQRVQQDKKVDQVFIKFLPWMAPRIAKDTTISNRQIREYEMKFKSWDTDMFSLMNDIINNIAVTPLTKLVEKCPICGEEVTAQMRFPNGIRSIFSVQSRHKKFGKK